MGGVRYTNYFIKSDGKKNGVTDLKILKNTEKLVVLSEWENCKISAGIKLKIFSDSKFAVEIDRRMSAKELSDNDLNLFGSNYKNRIIFGR